MCIQKKICALGLVLSGLILSASVLAMTDDDLNLISASGRGDQRIFKMMLAMGANPNGLDKGQNSAVLMAAYHSQRDMVRQLIDLHADVNVKGSIGYTPVGVAALRGDVEILKMLIAAGARLDVHDYAGGTPLLNALRVQRDENVALLLNADADVNLADSRGVTPLMAAAEMGRLDYVEALLGKGAQVSLRDPDGNTALYYAVFEGNDEVAKRLIRAGTVVYGLNNGYTLLHWARVLSRTDIVTLLQNAGAVN